MLTFQKVYDLCNKHQWFTCGTNTQYEKMFDMVREGKPIRDIATAIWLCSNDKWTVDDIEKELKKKEGKTVTVTVELRYRMAVDVDLPNDVYEDFINEDHNMTEVALSGDAFDKLHAEIAKLKGMCALDAPYEYESDYAITDADGNTIADWED